jgi:endonuclease YncB( thermonuclease family)
MIGESKREFFPTMFHLLIAIAIPTAPISCQYLYTFDGDTIAVNCRDRGYRVIRLCGIDAPEKDQPLGLESKQSLQALIEKDKALQVTLLDGDRYNRLIAEVWQGKKLLNDAQVRTGFAYYYAEYAAICPNQARFLQSEAIATASKLNIWSKLGIRPWLWRKGIR